MVKLKALIYLERSDQVETMTVEFKCWEQLYEAIQAVQIAHPSGKAGLERLLDVAPPDFPTFEWQMRWGKYANANVLLKPTPVSATSSPSKPHKLPKSPSPADSDWREKSEPQ
jgi:hypothetical protein